MTKAVATGRGPEREEAEPPDTEAYGQREKNKSVVPGSREYRKHVNKLLLGKMSYEDFIHALEPRHGSRDRLFRHFLRTVLEGLAGRSFPNRTPPR